jgi:hypothetical protein
VCGNIFDVPSQDVNRAIGNVTQAIFTRRDAAAWLETHVDSPIPGEISQCFSAQEVTKSMLSAFSVAVGKDIQI